MATVTITREDFDAIKRFDAASSDEFTDNPYAYETLLDADGNQLACATYHTRDGASFVRYDPPRPAVVYNDDGDEIVGGEG